MTTEVRDSDEELWTAGDAAAFGRLFDRHSRAVYNHAFRLTGSWASAEDVTQATFLVAWRRRSQARPVDGSVLPWLLVVASNIVRTEWRSARRWRALLRRVPPDDGVQPDPADDVAGRVDDEARMRRILAMVRRLPRAEREAVALCLWSGLGYPEAAVVLGVSEPAVRSRVSRARARLTRMVQEEEEQA